MRPSSTQWKVAAALAALFLITVVNGQLFSGKTTHAVSIFGFLIHTAAQFVWKISVDLDFPGFWSFYDQIGRIRVKFGRWFSDISVILSSQKEFQESFQHPPADWQIKFPIFFAWLGWNVLKFLLNFQQIKKLQMNFKVLQFACRWLRGHRSITRSTKSLKWREREEKKITLTVSANYMQISCKWLNEWRNRQPVGCFRPTGEEFVRKWRSIRMALPLRNASRNKSDGNRLESQRILFDSVTHLSVEVGAHLPPKRSAALRYRIGSEWAAAQNHKTPAAQLTTFCTSWISSVQSVPLAWLSPAAARRNSSNEWRSWKQMRRLPWNVAPFSQLPKNRNKFESVRPKSEDASRCRWYSSRIFVWNGSRIGPVRNTDMLQLCGRIWPATKGASNCFHFIRKFPKLANCTITNVRIPKHTPKIWAVKRNEKLRIKMALVSTTGRSGSRFPFFPTGRSPEQVTTAMIVCVCVLQVTGVEVTVCTQPRDPRKKLCLTVICQRTHTQMSFNWPYQLNDLEKMTDCRLSLLGRRIRFKVQPVAIESWKIHWIVSFACETFRYFSVFFLFTSSLRPHSRLMSSSGAAASNSTSLWCCKFTVSYGIRKIFFSSDFRVM